MPTGSTCTCVCDSPYTGSQCASCSTAFNPACNDCAADAIGVFPQCTQCSISACNSRASAVRAENGKCICSCAAPFGGDSCERCQAGFYNAMGTCTECNCNNRGTAIGSDGSTPDSCVCKCSGQWKRGATGGCSDCPAKYNQATCAACAPGVVAYPQCDTDCNTYCTSTVCAGGNCASGGQPNAAGTACECVCQPGYTGPLCTQCDYGYVQTASLPALKCERCDPTSTTLPATTRMFLSGCAFAQRFGSTPVRDACTCECMAGYEGDQCQRCTSGFVGYPACRRCSNAQDCSGNARLVEPLASGTGCKCACAGMWRGDKCDSCPPEYDQTTCDRCAEGYVGYPSCTRCTCDGHATTVTSDPTRTRCICGCESRFSCLAALATAANGSVPAQCERCDVCSAGHVGFPVCQACGIDAHCNGHASKVVANADRSACVCSCSTGYTGPSCGQCASGVGYPACTTCDPALHCSGHAVAVRPENGVCVCGCAASWRGQRCEICDERFDQATCAACALGHVKYPVCAKCTLDSCGGRGRFVTSDPTQSFCVCTCNEGFDGELCQRCAAGFFGYPNCRACSLTEDCSANAVAVGAPQGQGCTCICAEGYAGVRCESCAVGYVGYPNCRPCESRLDCNGRALTATANAAGTGCSCVCQDAWSPADNCATCPTNYGQSCKSCADGFFDYPRCVACDTATGCNGHALVSSVTANGGCRCECFQTHAGARCERCADGFIQYPLCTPCSLATDCSANAEAVTSDGNGETCVCSCKAGYAGKRCDRCASGYFGYPNCKPCDARACCGNSKAATVSTDGQRCLCECLGSWGGNDCCSCPTGQDCARCETGLVAPLCDACMAGYVGYPTCRACSLATDCGGHASVVTSDPSRTSCICTCKLGYSGPRCATCAAGYTRTAAGACVACDAELVCSGRSLTVWSADGGPCQCVCQEGYTGSDCAACGTGYMPEPVSGQRPVCTRCTVDKHCNARALAVTSLGNASQCLCTCAVGYVSSDVSRGQQCDACAPGWAGHPDCVPCTTDAYCRGRAVAATVDSMSGQCHCACQSPYEGPRCATLGACPSNGVLVETATGVASCRQCSLSEDCGGRASAVGAATDNRTCACVCHEQYTGARCDKCAVMHYAFPSCFFWPVPSTTAFSPTEWAAVAEAAISVGLSQAQLAALPDDQLAVLGVYTAEQRLAVRSAGCTVESFCYGMATAVSGTFPACACTCLPGYTGVQCSACSDPLALWPSCGGGSTSPLVAPYAPTAPSTVWAPLSPPLPPVGGGGGGGSDSVPVWVAAIVGGSVVLGAVLILAAVAILALAARARRSAAARPRPRPKAKGGPRGPPGPPGGHQKGAPLRPPPSGTIGTSAGGPHARHAKGATLATVDGTAICLTPRTPQSTIAGHYSPRGETSYFDNIALEDDFDFEFDVARPPPPPPKAPKGVYLRPDLSPGRR